MTTEERENRALAHFLIFCIALACVAFGMWFGNTFPSTSGANGPDWTVAPCSAWDGESAPVLPEYTRTDVCAVQTETGAWYMSSPDNPTPALDAPVTH